MSLFGTLSRSATAAVLLSCWVDVASAEEPPGELPPAIAGIPGLTADNPLQPASGFGRNRSAPGCSAYSTCPPGYPCLPGYPVPPGTVPPGTMPPSVPGMGEPTPPTQPQPQPQLPTAAPSAPDFGNLTGGAGVGATVGLGGYIENAAPVTMFRLRFDAGYGDNRPDRGEFFYAKCGCFGTRDAHGPPLMEKSVDYQDLIASSEYAFTQRFSAFFNIPIRFLNPQVNQDHTGLSDISFGGKYAFVYNQNRIMSLALTFQAPSGSLSTGLGNGNWWIIPALLYLEQLTPQWQFFGQFAYQGPLGTRSDFTGNMVNYGLGTSYVLLSGRWGYVAPVVECLGWTVLSGQEFNPDSGTAVAAHGTTIVNGKFGLRVGLGAPQLGTPYPTRSDIYIGYGRALTGAVWYKDLLRLEYRRFF